jgi:hypothetical protein
LAASGAGDVRHSHNLKRSWVFGSSVLVYEAPETQDLSFPHEYES